MNFYKHHLGDYDAATAHLLWIEDIAYTRLLRVCYRTEKPIPENVVSACRLVRAQGEAQRRAVEAMLNEFFTLQSDGWHNKRADEEIAAYQRQAATNRSIAQARELRKQENESLHESLNIEINESLTNRSTIGQPNHKPLAISQIKEEKPKSNTRRKPEPFSLPDWINPDTWQAYCDMRTKIHKPMTERAKALVVAELDKLRQAGSDPQALLDQSTRNCWQDVFPIRAKGNGQAPGKQRRPLSEILAADELAAKAKSEGNTADRQPGED